MSAGDITVKDLLAAAAVEGIEWGAFDLVAEKGWVATCPVFDGYASEAHRLTDPECPCKPQVVYEPDDACPQIHHNLTAHDKYLAQERDTTRS